MTERNAQTCYPGIRYPVFASYPRSESMDSRSQVRVFLINHLVAMAGSVDTPLKAADGEAELGDSYDSGMVVMVGVA